MGLNDLFCEYVRILICTTYITGSTTLNDPDLKLNPDLLKYGLVFNRRYVYTHTHTQILPTPLTTVSVVNFYSKS